MATLAEFKAEFPEFVSVCDEVVNRQVTKFNGSLSSDSWGDHFDEAVLYRAAHVVALSQARVASAQNVGDGAATVISSGSGSITSATGGGLSVTYAVPEYATGSSANDALLAQTPYGQHYLSLRESCLQPICLTTGF